MKRRWVVLLFVCFGVFEFGAGYYVGQVRTWQDIISERCWLNKQTRDIECICQVLR